MTDLPWFRFYSDAVDNEKLRLLAHEDRWHFVALLCCKRQGIIDQGNDLIDRKLSVKLGVQLRELAVIKGRLFEVGLITEDWQPVGWNEHQYVSDMNEYKAKKQKKYRQKKMGISSVT